MFTERMEDSEFTVCDVCSQLRGNNPCVLMAEQGRGKNFIVYKPNIGKQTHPESLDNLHQRYRKVILIPH